MTDAMDIDPPAQTAPANAMAALMAASKEKGKGKMEMSQSEEDAKDKKDKEGLPWYVRSVMSLDFLHPLVSGRSSLAGL